MRCVHYQYSLQSLSSIFGAILHNGAFLLSATVFRRAIDGFGVEDCLRPEVFGAIGVEKHKAHEIGRARLQVLYLTSVELVGIVNIDGLDLGAVPHQIRVASILALENNLATLRREAILGASIRLSNT